MTPLQLKHDLQQTKQAFFQGQATLPELHAAADLYITAVKNYKKENRVKRLRVPTRAELVR